MTEVRFSLKQIFYYLKNLSLIAKRYYCSEEITVFVFSLFHIIYNPATTFETVGINAWMYNYAWPS